MLLFENHSRSCRYNGPLDISPTLTATMGMGGNNGPVVLDFNEQKNQLYDKKERDDSIVSTEKYRKTGGNNIPMLVDDEVETAYCIASNTINRVEGNGGNGKGFSTEVSYTLLTSDIHAVYHHQPYQDKVGALCHRDHKGVNTTYVTQDKCIVDNESENFPRQLVRRLTPLECERLQGFPDNWTNIEGASDSPRYKALGNSVAIPCVEFVMKGIAFCLNHEYMGRKK